MDALEQLRELVGTLECGAVMPSPPWEVPGGPVVCDLLLHSEGIQHRNRETGRTWW
jgi:hypothetical protein